jgi:hypothetical protein
MRKKELENFKFNSFTMTSKVPHQGWREERNVYSRLHEKSRRNGGRPKSSLH